MKKALLTSIFIVTSLYAFSQEINPDQNKIVTAKLNSSSNLREKPSFDSKVIGLIPKDEEVTVYNDIREQFIRVNYNGKVGFIVYQSLVQTEILTEWVYGNLNKKDEKKTNSENPNNELKVVPFRSNQSEPSKTIQPANSSSPTPKTSTQQKPSNTRKYFRGPRGGCYYYSSSGKKVYVDRSLCN